MKGQPQYRIAQKSDPKIKLDCLKYISRANSNCIWSSRKFWQYWTTDPIWRKEDKISAADSVQAV